MSSLGNEGETLEEVHDKLRDLREKLETRKAIFLQQPEPILLSPVRVFFCLNHGVDQQLALAAISNLSLAQLAQLATMRDT